MHAVFLDQHTFSANISLQAIHQHVEVLTCFPSTSAEQIIERCQHADIVITNKVLLNAQSLQQLPKLKLICIAATGTNNVDLNAALELGIAVNNVSGYSTPSVSQYVFAQMLEYFNQNESSQSQYSSGFMAKKCYFLPSWQWH